jgi:DNA-binding GntR family transcriptional regulator
MAAAVEIAYDAIRSGIISGDYPGGAHLKAADVAAALGVSRTPVREALRRLHAEGLVDFVANRGAYVAAWNHTDVDEVFDLRALLESHAAFLAARNASAEQIAELRALALHMERAAREKPPRYLEIIADANVRFHKLIRVASGNKRLASFISIVVERPLMLRTFNRYRDEELLRSAAHHLEMVSAFDARDGSWAAAVMRSHVLAAQHVYRASHAAQASGRAA